MVFISSIVPQMAQSPTNPDGVPLEVLDSFRAAMLKDRAQFFRDVPSGPFFGFNRPNATTSQGLVDGWFAAGMQASFKAVFDTTRSWEVDYTEDLKSLGKLPVLIIQGSDDQVVPPKAASLRTIDIVENGTLNIYEGGAHGLPRTEPERVSNDLWEFIKT